MLVSARYALSRICIWLIVAAVFSGGSASLLASGPRLVSHEVINTASIPATASTVGIAGADIFFMSQADVNRTLDAMQSLGVSNIRLQIPWAAVEGTKGTYDWSVVDKVVNAAAARNMGILGVLNTTPSWAAAPGGTYPSGTPRDPAQFAKFAAAAATRYKGKVSAYEVWNEPNAAIFYSPTPNAAGYVAILKASYAAIKAADPTATVIGGVIASVPYTSGTTATNSVDFVAQMYAAGAAGYFDALSYHPYQYGLAFSTGMPVENSPIDQVQAIRALMVANGDAAKLIWATEYGAPVSASSEAMQAALISDFLNTWSTIPYAGPTFIYTTRDRQTGSTDPEATFGLLRTNWTLKAAATVVKNFIAGVRTTPYGSWPVVVISDMYDQWASQYGQALALQALANMYQQAVVDHGRLIADVYFNAVRMVISSALSAPPGTATTAKSVAIEAVKADIAAQDGVATTAAMKANVDSTPETGGPAAAESAATTTTVEQAAEVATEAAVNTESTTGTATDPAPAVVVTETLVEPAPVINSTPTAAPVTATQPQVTAPSEPVESTKPTDAAAVTDGKPAQTPTEAGDDKPAQNAESATAEPKTAQGGQPTKPGKLKIRLKVRDELASLRAKLTAGAASAAATGATPTREVKPSEPATSSATASTSAGDAVASE